MNIKRTIAWALIAMPLLAACDKDKSENDDNGKSSAEIALQSLVGEWNMNLTTPFESSTDSTIIQPDGSFKSFSQYSAFEEGRYKMLAQAYVEGKISYLSNGNLFSFNCTTAKARFLDEDDDGVNDFDNIEQAPWDTVPEAIGIFTTRNTLLNDGSVFIMEYLSKDSGFPVDTIGGIDMLFKKGATNLPSDKSLLQGTWYSNEDPDTVQIAFRISGDDVVFYSNHDFTKTYSGKYTYNNGVLSLGHNEMSVSRDSEGNDIVNPTNPFDVEWKPAEDFDVENEYEDGIKIAFIVNGDKAYCSTDGYSFVAIKQ